MLGQKYVPDTVADSRDLAGSTYNSIIDLFHSILELYKEYQEEAYAIDLHPSGHFIVVGFADKLRLMNLLIDDIRPFKEYSVRGCREVRTAGDERPVSWKARLEISRTSTFWGSRTKRCLREF